MTKHRPVTALVVTAALALVAAGCGSNADADTNGGGSQGDDGTFTVDASACPPEATQELAEGETLKVGTVWPLSGPYGAIGTPIVAGINAYFDKVNAEGGVDGHELELIAKDDGYDPTKTLPQVTELLQKDKVFATLGQGGTPNVAAAQPLAEQTCTPQLWVGTGAAQYGDPSNHAWTTTGFMSYATEAQAWADYLDREQPGAKVAVLQIENEGGESYAKSFAPAAEEVGIEVVASEKHSPTAATLENEVTNLLAAKPDAVVVMSIGSSCAKGIGALAQSGFTGTTIAAYTCAPALVFPALGPAAEGALSLAINKAPETTDDPDIEQFVADMEEFGDGQAADDDALTGYRLGDLFVKNLTAAAELEGGLTRANLMNAAWNLDDAGFAAWGGSAVTDGAKDSYVLEYGQMVQWDSAKGALVPTGEPIDREGKTGTYEG